MRIAIVGAGFVGATIAWRLAAEGRDVTLIDAAAPGAGLSARSFGWINHVTAEPEADPRLFRLRIEARRRFDAVDGRLFGPWRGALVWHDDPERTEALIARHNAHGGDLVAVGPEEFDRIAPHVAVRPALAAHAPRDIAVAPGPAAGRMAEAAVAAGARLLSGYPVLGVETASGRVTGLALTETRLAADIVVLAAGAGIGALLPDPAALPPIRLSPAALVTLAAEGPAPAVVLAGAGLEIRPGQPGHWIAAARPPERGETLDDLGARIRDRAAALMPGLRRLQVLSSLTADRPMPDPGLLVRHVSGAEGLIVAAGHPGVILAPFIADAVAELAAD